jgi:hypothetical protein
MLFVGSGALLTGITNQWLVNGDNIQTVQSLLTMQIVQGMLQIVLNYL